MGLVEIRILGVIGEPVVEIIIVFVRTLISRVDGRKRICSSNTIAGCVPGGEFLLADISFDFSESVDVCLRHLGGVILFLKADFATD